MLSKLMQFKLMYLVTFRSKKNIKNLLLVHFFLKNLSLGHVSIPNLNNHKNVILNSPFHFKTVKTHTKNQTAAVTIVLNYSHSQILCFKLLGLPLNTTKVLSKQLNI